MPPLVVTDPAAARFLSDVRSLRLLEPFLDRDCSVKEASEALGLSLQSMHYRVGRMVALDLIAVVGSEPRRGRPIKRYRAIADSFFVPLSLLDEGPDAVGDIAANNDHAKQTFVGETLCATMTFMYHDQADTGQSIAGFAETGGLLNRILAAAR